MLRKKRPDGRLTAQQAADPAAALTAAVTLLARRDFCSGELRLKLTEQGFEAAALDPAIADLQSRHYLDDERYAQQFVAYHAQRGHGPQRIRRDLADLALSEELIDTALQAHGDWPRLAREVRIRRFGLAQPQGWPEKARQMRFLQYRGFSGEDIRAAVGGDAIEADE